MIFEAIGQYVGIIICVILFATPFVLYFKHCIEQRFVVYESPFKYIITNGSISKYQKRELISSHTWNESCKIEYEKHYTHVGHAYVRRIVVMNFENEQYRFTYNRYTNLGLLSFLTSFVNMRPFVNQKRKSVLATVAGVAIILGIIFLITTIQTLLCIY